MTDKSFYLVEIYAKNQIFDGKKQPSKVNMIMRLEPNHAIVVAKYSTSENEDGEYHTDPMIREADIRCIIAKNPSGSGDAFDTQYVGPLFEGEALAKIYLDEPTPEMHEIPVSMPVRKQQIGGDHYKKMSIQPWDAMAEWMTPDEFRGFLLGNVIKYVARHRSKNGLEDLKKAQHYLSKVIELEENNDKHSRN